MNITTHGGTTDASDKQPGVVTIGSKDGLGCCVVDILKEIYTLKKPCCVSDEPDAHTVWLKIGNQSFRLDGYFETADEAEWMRKMLATALMNFQLDTDKLKQPNALREPSGTDGSRLK